MNGNLIAVAMQPRSRWSCSPVVMAFIVGTAALPSLPPLAPGQTAFQKALTEANARAAVCVAAHRCTLPRYLSRPCACTCAAQTLAEQLSCGGGCAGPAGSISHGPNIHQSAAVSGSTRVHHRLIDAHTIVPCPCRSRAPPGVHFPPRGCGARLRGRLGSRPGPPLRC